MPAVNNNKAKQARFIRLWWVSSGRRCKCGRVPEKNALCGQWTYSLSCKCGGSEVKKLVQSNIRARLLDNWESLVRDLPFKHRVQELLHPHAAPQSFNWPGDFDEGRHQGNSLAQYVEAHGGHCAGFRGGCS